MRHRRPQSTAGRPPTLDIVDDEWAAATLSDDEIDAKGHEDAISSLLEEGELDVDAVVVPTGSVNGAAERRRREEGRWNDLGLDYFDPANNASNAAGSNNQTGNAGIGSSSQ